VSGKHIPSSAAGNVDDEAADWYARHERGLTSEEAETFAKWLDTDAEHRRVWREFAALLAPWSPRVPGAWTAVLEGHAKRRRRSQWRKVGTAAAALAVSAIAFSLYTAQSTERLALSSPTPSLAVAVPESITLPDGSTVELAPGAVISHDYSDSHRHVSLVSGTAYFAVEKDPVRPFVVTASNIEVRAVGTAFSVTRDPDQVNVLVTHGRVAVERPADESHTAPSSPVFADAGENVVVKTSSQEQPVLVKRYTDVDIEAHLAWRGPRLDLSATPLSDVVLAMNAANRVQLRVGDNHTGGLRLTGVFRADNAEGFARMLQANYGVVTERQGDMIILRSVAR
jgi:transmembrane sensor